MDILISVNESGLDYKTKEFQKHFKPKLVNLNEALLFHFSPVLFKDNYRKTQNFLEAYSIVLDVDNGVTLNDAMWIIKSMQLTAVVAITKSHRIPKGTNPPKDRFRIIFPITPIKWGENKVEIFKHNAKKLAKIFLADMARTDAAPYFAPAKEVVFVNKGKLYELEMPQPVKVTTRTNVTMDTDITTLPAMQELLNGKAYGAEGTGRHHVLLRAAVLLAANNFSKEEIVEILSAHTNYGREHCIRLATWATQNVKSPRSN